MSAAAGMAIVLFAFFLVGVTMGIIVVIAMSARRGRHGGSPRAPGQDPRGTWPYLRQAGPDSNDPADLRSIGVPEYGRLGPMDVSLARARYLAQDSQ
jgi:hypothetical protein